MSSSPWLLSEDVFAARSSELMQSSLSGPSSSSCSRSLSEDRALRTGAADSSRLRRRPDERLKGDRYFVIRARFTRTRTPRYLRAEVVPSGESGLWRSCQSRSLILIVSSAARRHTKMQLVKKSIWALKIQHDR